MQSELAVVGLTVDGCRKRQEALRRVMDHENLDAALILDRRHVHYFTGYWHRAVFAAALLIERDGPATLVVPLPPETESACDQWLQYESNRLGTLVDDHPSAALQPLLDRLAKHKRLGSDGPIPHWLIDSGDWVNLLPAIKNLRRRKMVDEVALLRQAIQATEAAYQYAKDHLAAGVTEVELFAGMQMAAANCAGEVLGEFGNDFQIGGVGSAPRRRAAQDGEVAVLDVSVVLRGYRSDLCRSFVVGRRPSDAQRAAYERIIQVLALVEERVRPGVSCRRVFEEAHALLEGFRGWSFPHHLGHGIGLSAHEAPRLNPHWDDEFAVGDVFTAEPGLYDADLRAGMRIEQNYWLTETGLVRLSSFPPELI